MPEAVICVPFCFTDKNMLLVRKAAENGGFKVLRIISEPSAALLAYDIGQDNPKINKYCIVFRQGGGTTDCSLVRVKNGIYQVINNETLNFGSDEATAIILNYLSKEFSKKYRVPEITNQKSLYKLWLAAEQIKHSLSSLNNASASIDSLSDGMDFEVSVSKSRFEGLCSDYLKKCKNLVNNLLSICKNENILVDTLIFCGGGCRMPLLRQNITQLLPEIEVVSSLPYEEVMALGAAKESSILTSLKNLQRIEPSKVYAKCTDYDLFLRTGDNDMQLISKYCPLPLRERFDFKIGQFSSSICFSFYYLENNVKKDLGDLILRDVDDSCDSYNLIIHVELDSTIDIFVSSSDGSISENLTIESG